MDRQQSLHIALEQLVEYSRYDHSESTLLLIDLVLRDIDGLLSGSSDPQDSDATVARLARNYLSDASHELSSNQHAAAHQSLEAALTLWDRVAPTAITAETAH